MIVKRTWKIAIFVMLVPLILLGSIQTASAGPLGGGDSFENATQIYSGYSAEAIYPVDSEDYFYILVNPGQRLVVKGSDVNEDYCEIDISVHDKR